MECIIFGDTVTAGIGSLSSKLSPTVRNLYMIFFSDLKFAKQINNVVKTSFFSITSPSQSKNVFKPSQPWESHLACSRCWRRGRKGGVLLRLQTHLAVSSASDPRRGHLVGLSWNLASYDMKCSSEYCYRWLWLTVLDAGYLLPWHWPIRICSNGELT